jgi:transmembrane 9 superfamily member 3
VNGAQVIEVNMTSELPVAVEAGKTYDLTYSVTWVETDHPFARRFERYLDYNFFEHQIHWFSLFNSFMMVVFLCGLVALILMRTLRADYARYMRDEDGDAEMGAISEQGACIRRDTVGWEGGG